MSAPIPPGYKMTEVGVIPQDWSDVVLESVTEKVGSGITPRGGSKIYLPYGRPFIRSQNVGWGILSLEDLAFISDEIHATFDATEIQLNDVFLNITGASIGRSALADERVAGGNVNQHVCIIRSVADDLYPRYLNYFLLSSLGQQQIDSFQAGGNRQGLNFGQIKSFRLPLPPTLAEQRAIAEALSDVDAQIAALDALIAKKRAIKQGAMQRLLTGEERLPGFDGAWEVKRLGEICTISAGGDFDPIRSSDIQSESYNYPIYANALSNGGLYGYCSYAQYIAGSITVTARGTLGFAKQRDHAFTAIGRLLVLSPNINLSGKYLAEFINNRVEFAIESTGVPQLTAPQISKYTVCLPSVDEQTAIAAVLSDIDEEISALEAEREKAVALKQGMMQELLTGRTRLL